MEATAQQLKSQLTCMITPVTVDSILAGVLAFALQLEPKGSPPFNGLMPRQNVLQESTSEAIVGASTNAAVIVAFAASCTYLFAALYSCRCQLAMHAVVLVAFAIPVTLLVLYVAASFGAEWIAGTWIAWNLGAGAAWAIVYSSEHQLPLAKPAIVGASVALAWPFLCLDELTFWASLAGLVIWDIFAVTSPVGSFRIILAHQQQRTLMADAPELPVGLLYETDTGFSLGTGDFLFYGVLVGRASMRGVAPAAAACLGIFIGITLTVLWSLIKRGGAVPALPATLVLGMLLFASISFLLSPALSRHLARSKSAPIYV